MTVATILPGPDTVIADIHELGVHLGFERVRIDRSALPDRPDVWFEVGYGCQEIKVRFSGLVPEYRATWDQADLDVISGRLIELLDSGFAPENKNTRKDIPW